MWEDKKGKRDRENRIKRKEMRERKQEKRKLEDRKGDRGERDKGFTTEKKRVRLGRAQGRGRGGYY